VSRSAFDISITVLLDFYIYDPCNNENSLVYVFCLYATCVNISLYVDFF